jgi:hypothetical protein
MGKWKFIDGQGDCGYRECFSGTLKAPTSKTIIQYEKYESL